MPQIHLLDANFQIEHDLIVIIMFFWNPDEDNVKRKFISNAYESLMSVNRKKAGRKIK